MRRILILIGSVAGVATALLHASERDDLTTGAVPEQAILRSGRTFAWIRALEADAAREPSNAELHAALALGYYLAGQQRFAKEESRLALSLGPDSLQSNYIAGRIAMEVDKNYREAIGRFQKVLSVQARNFKARYFLGVCFRNLGERARALEAFRTASVNAPYDWAVVAIAEMQLDTGDAHGAIDAALKACEMNRSAENLLLAGKALSASGESSRAREYLEEAIKADPAWDTPHYLLARIYSRTPGHEQQARAERERFEALRNAAL